MEFDVVLTSMKERGQTFLQQYDSSKSIIQVPEVDTAHSALVVQLSINVECLVGRDLQLPHPLARNGSIFEWRIKLVTPRGPVTVPIAVIVAEEVVTVGLRAAADLERLVNGSKEIFCQVWNEGSDGLQVPLCVAGGEAAEKIAGIWMSWSASSRGAGLRYVGLDLKRRMVMKIGDSQISIFNTLSLTGHCQIVCPPWLLGLKAS